MSQVPEQDRLLKDQYADASNLNARARLHARFSTNKYGWMRWVFDRFDLPEACRVLELGCGTGTLWRENRRRIPPGWDITLSDSSPGMLAEAKRNLGHAGRDFAFQLVHVRAIPFQDENFEGVIANHMLYHVPHLDSALTEIRRVLKPGGRFYAATNGAGHMNEIREMVRLVAPEVPFGAASVVRSFALENGEALLGKYFSNVALYRHNDSLEITQAEPLVAYVVSVRGKSTLTDEQAEELKRIAQQRIDSAGAIHVTKDQGMFEATRPANR